MVEWSNAQEPLRRVLVVGPPGVGKTWVSTRVASTLGLPHVELDGIKLRPVRQLATPSEYEAGVRAVLDTDAWLLDGNWSDDALGEDAWRAADLVVWLDYPRQVVMRQVAIRSVRRLVTRQEYYGWTESVRDWFSPTHPLRWSWRMVAGYADRYSSMAARFAPRKHVRLTSRDDADRFVQQGPQFSESSQVSAELRSGRPGDAYCRSVHEIEFVPTAVRAAFAQAADAFVDLVGGVPATAWSEPALGLWNVRDLVGHASRALVTVSAYLEAGAGKPVDVASPFDYFAVLTSAYADQDEVAERGRQAGRDLGDDPVARVAERRDAALAAMAAAADDAPVASPAGVMRLIDYLPSRIFELTIHTADIARAAGVPFSPDPGATTITFACLASVAIARGVALDALLAMAGRGPLPDGYSAL